MMDLRLLLIVLMGLLHAVFTTEINTVKSLNNVSSSIQLELDYDELLRQYPDSEVILLEEMSTTKKDTRDIVVYTIGRREYGDRLVANGVDRVTFLTPRDAQQIFEYPDVPPGAIVTYVQINIEQEGNAGRAYVINGGIGQRRIVIGVEAYATRIFGHELFSFGIY